MKVRPKSCFPEPHMTSANRCLAEVHIGRSSALGLAQGFLYVACLEPVINRCGRSNLLQTAKTCDTKGVGCSVLQYWF